jgi:hypothetical protein
MNRMFCLFSCLLLSSTAFATESVKSRAEAADAAERTPFGDSYLNLILPAISEFWSEAAEHCFKVYTQTQSKRFTLVANVLPDGTVIEADVEPREPGPLCYAKAFAQLKLPPLDPSFQEPFFPVAVRGSRIDAAAP